MRILRIILFVYCLIALPVFGWLIWDKAARASGYSSLIQQHGLELARQQAVEADARSAWQRLDNEQRREREHYSGEEAVAASYVTQKALERFEAARDSRMLIEKGLAGLQTDHEECLLAIVPLAAVALLHLFGALALWPRKPSLRSRNIAEKLRR